MTPKIRWPNDATRARLDSIALAESIKRQVIPMLEALESGKNVSALELSLRLNRISNSANDIALKLMQAGPQKFL
jgi:hypothetical protein